MTISFDLDDTLIPGTKSFPVEVRNLFQRLLSIEKLRLGTKELFNALKSDGHSICIYTTSFRSAALIRFTLWTYGLLVGTIVNQKKHDEVLKSERNKCSKFPPAFKIDLHVDDSPGVQIEGARYDFKTIIIDEKNENWVKHIITSIKNQNTI